MVVVVVVLLLVVVCEKGDVLAIQNRGSRLVGDSGASHKSCRLDLSNLSTVSTCGTSRVKALGGP